MSATLPNKQPRIRKIKIVHGSRSHGSDNDSLTELETASDEEGMELPKARPGATKKAQSKKQKEKKKSKRNETNAYNDSPLKRKRSPSPLKFAEISDNSDSDETSVSLNESDFADIGDSEDEFEIERIENEALIQDEEDRSLLEGKFHVIDDEQPFAYAVEDDSDQDSNLQENWIEDFEALTGSNAPFEAASLPKFQLATEDSNEVLFEEEFFLGYDSSDGGGDDDDDDALGEVEDESPFMQDDDDDKVGWECFFSHGESESDSEHDDSDGGSTTDEEPVPRAPPQSKQQGGKSLAPITPAKTPAKSNLTSCLKKTHVTNIETPSRPVAGTPIKLNTSHRPPVLASWARDNRLSTGIIDGITIHSPGDLPESSKKLRSKSTSKTQPPTDAVAEAMTSLDDIMYTNDLLTTDAEVQKAPPSRFNKPIHVGAFRKGQARSSLMREDSLKNEWYTMTSRNKERPGRTKATPVLGVGPESLSRRDKRRRKKMRAAAGMSVGGSTFGGSIDEGASDNEYFNDGVERAGLGLGPPIESLFLFHQY